MLFGVSQQQVSAGGCRFFGGVGNSPPFSVRPAFRRPGHRLPCLPPGSGWRLFFAAGHGLYGRAPAGIVNVCITVRERTGRERISGIGIVHSVLLYHVRDARARVRPYPRATPINARDRPSQGAVPAAWPLQSYRIGVGRYDLQNEPGPDAGMFLPYRGKGSHGCIPGRHPCRSRFFGDR